MTTSGVTQTKFLKWLNGSANNLTIKIFLDGLPIRWSVFLYLCVMKKIELGIKSKVFLGSTVIGLILLLSCVISFVEFERLSNYVSSVLADNIACVNTSRNLMNISEEYNTYILEQIGSDDSFGEIHEVAGNEDFISNFENLKHHFTIEEEKVMADSVQYAFVAYMHVVNELPDIWTSGYTYRREWYFERVQGVYDKLREYIQELTLISQNALAENYYHLHDRFYRSITPIIVAAFVGIILVILFNYFINIFFITPVIKINKGLKSYREYNKGYDVKFDHGRDQMQELNENIKEIIEENRSLKRKL